MRILACKLLGDAEKKLLIEFAARLAIPFVCHPFTKRRKEKESVLPRIHGLVARAREELPPVIDLNTPPSLELLLAFAHRRSDIRDTFTREWHRIMSDEFEWCHPETGTPIRHWPAYFRLWRINRPFFEGLRDPERITGQGGGKRRRAEVEVDNGR